MVAVDELLAESLGACIREWFEPGFSHAFLGLQTIGVPDSVKPIPKRWVEDVEVQIDEGFGAEDGDVLGEGPPSGWNAEEGRMRLLDALARLGLSESHVAHPNLNKMSRHELANEKRRVKQELKRYDAEFRRQCMRLPTHTEKEPMRPLYVYYRRLKTMISSVEQSRSGRHGGAANAAGSDDEGPGPSPGQGRLADGRGQREGPGGSVKEQIASIEARIASLQNEKAAVRAKLQAFQEKFLSENQRKIRFHKDILPIEREYRMYKNLKDEITKAESQMRDLRTET